MDQTVSKSLRYFVIFIVLFLVILLPFATYNYSHFHIISTSPKTDSVSVISPSFNVNFNKPLSSKNLAVSGTRGLISSFYISGKVLNITLNEPLNDSTTYTITINSVQSTTAKVIVNKVYSFKPKQIPYNKLSSTQQQQLMQPQANFDKNIQGSGLTSKLPFIGPGLDYKIDYTLSSGANPQPIIIITAPTDAYKQQALAWITNQGYNVSGLNIEYVTEQP